MRSRTTVPVSVELPPAAPPSHEEIAARAYELYRRRGAADGGDLVDWLEAERQLAEERMQAVAGV